MKHSFQKTRRHIGKKKLSRELKFADATVLRWRNNRVKSIFVCKLLLGVVSGTGGARGCPASLGRPSALLRELSRVRQHLGEVPLTVPERVLHNQDQAALIICCSAASFLSSATVSEWIMAS